jgi:hypothetical protein
MYAQRQNASRYKWLRLSRAYGGYLRDGLSFAKTRRRPNLMHVTGYVTYVADFKCASNFGEAVCPGKVGMFSRR